MAPVKKGVKANFRLTFRVRERVPSVGDFSHRFDSGKMQRHHKRTKRLESPSYVQSKLSKVHLKNQLSFRTAVLTLKYSGLRLMLALTCSRKYIGEEFL